MDASMGAAISVLLIARYVCGFRNHVDRRQNRISVCDEGDLAVH